SRGCSRTVVDYAEDGLAARSDPRYTGIQSAGRADEFSALKLGCEARRAPPEKLSEHDLNELASKTMEAQGRLVNLRMFLEFEKKGLGTLDGRSGSKPQ